VEGPLTKARVADALMKTGGLLTVAATALKVTRPELVKAFGRWPTLYRVQEEAKEAILDGVEWALIRAARGGEPWAVQYFLRHQGQERGYAEVHKSEHQARIQVDVAYTQDALSSGQPTTVVTPLPPLAPPPPQGAESSQYEPAVEVVEADVGFPAEGQR